LFDFANKPTEKVVLIAVDSFATHNPGINYFSISILKCAQDRNSFMLRREISQSLCMIAKVLLGWRGTFPAFFGAVTSNA
jgi:hypothetical protein